MVIIGLLIVKNEEDILEEMINWYKNQCLDGLIVCDIGSSDQTLEIINSYLNDFILKLITEEKFYQAEITKKMANIAKKEYDVDWIIPLDADEFYYPKTEYFNLKSTIKFLNDNGLCNIYVPRKKYLPSICDNNEDSLVKRYNFWIKQKNPKAIAKLTNKIVFEPGNHQILNGYDKYPLTFDNQFLEVRHYEIRTKKQLKNKINKVKQVWKYIWNYDKNKRGHWFKWYKKNKSVDELTEDIWNSIFLTRNKIKSRVKKKKLFFDNKPAFI